MIAYDRTALGQLVYDLGFTKLPDSYLALKHRKTIAEIRTARAAVMRGLKPAKKRRAK